MKIQFSYRERLAGVLVLVAVLGMLLFIVGAAIENRWLEPRRSFYTIVMRGDGLRTGSSVLLSGFEVGEVGKLEIMNDNRIQVELLIREQHAHRIKAGSVAEIRRLLGIGEKRIQIVSELVSQGRDPLPAGAFLPADERVDLLEAVSSVDIGRYMETMDRAVSAGELVLSKLEEEGRLERMMEAFDELGPTMSQLNVFLEHMDGPLTSVFNDPNLKQTLGGAAKVFNDRRPQRALRAVGDTMEAERRATLIENMVRATAALEATLNKEGHFAGAVEGADQLLHDGRVDRVLTVIEKLSDEEKLTHLVDNLAELTEQMAKVAPEIPSMSKEMVSAMREAVVVLKALQKTWLLKDESQEVRAAGASAPGDKKKK